MKIRLTMEQFNRRLSSKPRQVFYTNVSPAKEGVGISETWNEGVWVKMLETFVSL